MKRMSWVGEDGKHAGGSCPIAPTIHGARQPVRAKRRYGQRLGAPIELTPHALRHTAKFGL